MIAGIVLGAGKSERMRRSKLNLPLGSKKLIEWVLESVTLSLLDEIFLVIKPDDKNITEIARKWNVKIVYNPDYKKGMSTSIQKALIKLDTQDKEIDGFCLILGDQPFINHKIINQLIKNFTRGKKEIVVPYYQGNRGNPVLFDMEWKKDFMEITGDTGGRVLIRKYPDHIKKVDILDKGILFDIDREEDYSKAKRYFRDKGKLV
jgi:molybdenum cofactor cytidylyltransferase